jgi:hypothetical protein
MWDSPRRCLSYWQHWRLKGETGHDSGPLGTLAGTALGSLIGLLGGPAGLAIGATVGLTAGATVYLSNAWISGDFIDDVTKVLVPNSIALVAEIEKTGRLQWTPVWRRSAELSSDALFLMSRTPRRGTRSRH